jgi:hypothetical protein
VLTISIPSYEDVQPVSATPARRRAHQRADLVPHRVRAAEGGDYACRRSSGSSRLSWLRRRNTIHSSKVFGIWSLADRSTAAKKTLEDQLDAAFDFYHKEVDQRQLVRLLELRRT